MARQETVAQSDGNSLAKPSSLDGEKYLNLETYRKSGIGVRTPVWFAISPDGQISDASKFYVYTTANSGKAKRIRQSGVAKVAPCDMRGNPTGPWIDARAEIVSGADFDQGMNLLNRKYRPWKQMLDLFSLLSRSHQRVMIVIRLI